MNKIATRDRFTVGIIFVAASMLLSCVSVKAPPPECWVFSICSLVTLELAILNPEVLTPHVPTKGPGQALASVSSTEKVKSGQACTYMVLGTFAWGDASISQAKIESGVNTVAAVDYEQFSVLYFVYSEFCTIVTGI